MYLRRAVDAEGEVLDCLVQSHRNKRAALRLMRKLIRKYRMVPSSFVTDRLPFRQQQEPNCHFRSPTREAYDKTTGQRARMLRCGGESGRCNASDRRDRVSGSSQHIVRSITRSTSVAILSRLQRSVGSAPRPSRHGVPPRALLSETTFNSTR